MSNKKKKSKCNSEAQKAAIRASYARKPKNEFRYNNDTNHIDYVFEDDGKRFASVGITHAEKTFGKTNMPLTNNPEKGHFEDAYIRNGFNRKPYKNYSSQKKNFKFSEEDFPKVKSKIRNYKKNRKRNRKKNK